MRKQNKYLPLQHIPHKNYIFLFIKYIPVFQKVTKMSKKHTKKQQQHQLIFSESPI